MKFTPLSLQGACLVELEKIEDARGFFARQYCDKEFSEHGLNTSWVQINVAMNRETGTVRGLHFQPPPNAEIKTVRCLKGAILDVIVDLRKGSPDFGKWLKVELNEENRAMLYIPEGFAHGYQTLRPDTEILYFHSAHYSAGVEAGLRFDDRALGITWPLPPLGVSARDMALPEFAGFKPLDIAHV